MKKIKVAYLDYSKVYSGAEVSLEHLIGNIDRSCIDPMIYFIFPLSHHVRYHHIECRKVYLEKDKKWWMGSDYWKRPLRGTDFIKRSILGFKLALSLRKAHVRILHINLAKSDNFWWVFWAKLAGVKVVLHCRSDPIEWVPGKKVQWFADEIISVSDFVKKKVIQKNLSAPVTTVYDPVVFNDFGYDASLKYEALGKLGFDARVKLISSVGLLSPNKGHDNAIRVFARLLERFPDLTLYIAGGGSVSEQVRLLEIAESEGVVDKVYFSHGQISNISDVYRASEFVFSLTKRGEAFGRVPFESMSYGVPVIAPNIGGAAELIESRKTGFLVDANNIEDILSQATFIMSEMSFAYEVAEQGRVRFRELLSPRRAAASVEKVYLDCIQ
ncbi:glycosyltransferase family 4 protein [Alloalcanivorax profundimaris]|uniref:glycosyltransferase family 4 protein n=1 Tax=Alloalcanivorax profundimaris TaxID=2735259 RepID=UPI001890BDF6|nr:glycosyltransferase family 4 protein [Alloalcanivorax profundimaris]